MDTFDTLLMFTLTVIGAGGIGYGVFLLSKGPEHRQKGLGNIVTGIGFALMGWDVLSSSWPTVLTLVGAALSVVGGVMSPMRSKRTDGTPDA